MSGLAAETFHLTGFGRIETGARANLVVFDPERVVDRATFEDPTQYPEGIETVIVEGRVAIQRGRGGRGSDQRGSGSGVAVRHQRAQ